jgi:dimethylargininase
LPIAITRALSPSIVRCELTHLKRVPIDFSLAEAQHRRYEECLAELGCKVIRLPVEPELPDAVFVEDTALVLDELAVILNPGAVSRRPETASIALALAPFRKLEYLGHEGTIDGGDVLCVGRSIFVGLTTRSNPPGIERLSRLLKPYDYRVTGVAVKGCLHLKSAVTCVADEILLINRRWVDAQPFSAWKLIEIDPSEPAGANALRIGNHVIYPAAFPLTRGKLERQGISVHAIDLSELAKAEAAVTCCSLIFREIV